MICKNIQRKRIILLNIYIWGYTNLLNNYNLMVEDGGTNG